MKQFRHYTDDSGQVLVGIVMLSLVLLIMLSVATTAIANAVFTTGVSSDHTEAQAAAQSADNWTYTLINNNAQVLAQWLSQRIPAGSSGWVGLTDPTNNIPFTGPSIYPISGSSLPWLQSQPDGSLSACKVYNQACVQVQMRYSSPKLTIHSGDQTINEEALVQIRARITCHSATIMSGNSGCPTWTYQSLLRRRTFLDYLYFTNYETVEPWLYSSAKTALAVDGKPLIAGNIAFSSGCVNALTTTGCLQPVYGGASGASSASSDNVDGPIHTNSNTILVCGDPTFSSPASLGGGAYIEDGSGTVTRAKGCPDVSTPTSGVYKTSAVAFPQGDSSLCSIAAAGGSCSHGQGTVFSSGTTIQGYPNCPSGSTQPCVMVTAPNTSPQPYYNPPSTGVLYVKGDASVAGYFKGDWTIAASGSITVGVGTALDQNNLWLSCQGSSTPTATIPPGCNSMVGLVANNDIILNDSNYSNGADYPNNAGMSVSAAMMALGSFSTSSALYNQCGGEFSSHGTSSGVPECGSIYSAQWDQAPPKKLNSTIRYPAPTLTIQGAMVSYYRGLFGVYSTGSNSGINYGMAKKFSYDARFMSQQPPWFLQPTASSWAIIGFTQTGATTGAP